MWLTCRLARPPRGDRCRPGSRLPADLATQDFVDSFGDVGLSGLTGPKPARRPVPAGTPGTGTQQGQRCRHLLVGQFVNEVLELLPLRAHGNQRRWQEGQPVWNHPTAKVVHRRSGQESRCETLGNAHKRPAATRSTPSPLTRRRALIPKDSPRSHHRLTPRKQTAAPIVAAALCRSSAAWVRGQGQVGRCRAVAGSGWSAPRGADPWSAWSTRRVAIDSSKGTLSTSSRW
jgi:hypothetical protein